MHYQTHLYSTQILPLGSQIENMVGICVEVNGCGDWHVAYMLHGALSFHDMNF